MTATQLALPISYFGWAARRKLAPFIFLLVPETVSPSFMFSLSKLMWDY